MIRFDDILRMRQKELKHYLAGHLKKLGYETVKKKGFLYAEGTVPVLLVAHLDTVHNELPHRATPKAIKPSCCLNFLSISISPLQRSELMLLSFRNPATSPKRTQAMQL